MLNRMATGPPPNCRGWLSNVKLPRSPSVTLTPRGDFRYPDKSLIIPFLLLPVKFSGSRPVL